VASDQLAGAREGGNVLLSALGDDAVVAGAVALARLQAGRDPFQKRFAVLPAYPKIDDTRFGEITIGGETFARDVILLVGGSVKKRKKGKAKKRYGTSHLVGPDELERVCRGGPEVVFIGTGQSGQVQLTDEAQRYLSQRSIECRAMPTPDVVIAYNKSGKRKAALIHVTC